MITVEEALAHIQALAQPLPPLRLPLSEARGLVLTEDLQAPVDLPLFTNAAMDGFALLSQETAGASPSRPVPLEVRGTVRAGDQAAVPLAPGSAVRAMTGAPLPEGADAVVLQEEVQELGNQIMITRPIRALENIRVQGEELHQGDLALPRGTLLTPPALGLLAALGIERPHVHPRPRVGLIVTGDELVEPGARLSPGAVRDTHTVSLVAALAELGITPSSVARVPDDRPRLQETLRPALGQVEVLVYTGGMSVGEFDYGRGVLTELGVTRIFWGVAQKPGKPLFFGRRGGTLVFGLPGNPVSALVCYYEYVRPALLGLMGVPAPFLPSVQGMLQDGYIKGDERVHFLRGQLHERDGRLAVRLAGPQGSHILSGFANADCLVVIPRGPQALKAGTEVTVHLLPWARLHPLLARLS